MLAHLKPAMLSPPFTLASWHPPRRRAYCHLDSLVVASANAGLASWHPPRRRAYL